MYFVVMTVMAYTHTIIDIMSKFWGFIYRLDMMGFKVSVSTTDTTLITVLFKDFLFPFSVFWVPSTLIRFRIFSASLIGTLFGAVSVLVLLPSSTINQVTTTPLKYFTASITLTLYSIMIFYTFLATVVLVTDMGRRSFQGSPAVQTLNFNLLGSTII